MANVKFGAGQVNNPTPSAVNLWVRVYTVTASIFMVWLPTSGVVGPHTAQATCSILSLTLLLANGLAPLFGVKLPGKTVKAKNVTAVSAPLDEEVQNKKTGL